MDNNRDEEKTNNNREEEKTNNRYPESRNNRDPESIERGISASGQSLGEWITQLQDITNDWVVEDNNVNVVHMDGLYQEKLEKWVIDKFYFLLSHDPNNIKHAREVIAKVLVDTLVGLSRRIDDIVIDIIDEVTGDSRNVDGMKYVNIVKQILLKEGNDEEIMKRFFKEKDLNILKDINDFKIFFTKLKAKNYMPEIFRENQNIPVDILLKMVQPMFDLYYLDKKILDNKFFFIFGQLLTSSFVPDNIKDGIITILAQPNKKILKKALNHIDINVQNSDGNPILLLLVNSNDIDFIKYLLKKYKNTIDINIKNGVGNTLLIVSILYNNRDFVKYLLRKYKNTIDINIKNLEGKTALIYSVIENQNDIVNMLLNIKKIKINIKDNDNKNALFYAMKNDVIPSLPMSEYLISKGAKYLDDDDITNKKCKNLKKIISNEIFKDNYGTLYQTLCEISTQKTGSCDKILDMSAADMYQGDVVEIDPDNKIIAFFKNNKTIEEIFSINSYKFEGEDGEDAGGVTRMYWNGMGKELIELGLFKLNNITGFGEINPKFDCKKKIVELQEKIQEKQNSDEDEKLKEHYRSVINKLEKFDSYLNFEDIEDFELYSKIGQMFAKAFMIGEPLRIPLSFNILYRLVYRKLSKDIYGVILYLDDRENFTSLYGLLGNSEIIGNLMMNFVDIGEKERDVTDKNYDEYIHKKTKWLLDKNNFLGNMKKITDKNNESKYVAEIVASWEDKLSGFVQGFNSIIGRKIINKHNVLDIQERINGIKLTDKVIIKWANLIKLKDTSDPRQNEVFTWFIQIIKDLEGSIHPEEVANKKEKHFSFIEDLIEFMTGRTALDLNHPRGFNVDVQVQKSINHIPSAHTCFNEIDLPPYNNKAALYEKLVYALANSAEGTQFIGGKRRKTRKKTNKLKKSKSERKHSGINRKNLNRKKINKSKRKHSGINRKNLNHKKINKSEKSKPKRKHSGINQQTGRLKKGFKYSGKKLKSGLPEIIKVKKIKN
jgi:hypothetical protein